MTSKRKWLRAILIGAVLLVAANVVISGVLQTSAARRYLLARLVASFGRPVEVSRFNFNLLDGARLEASSVTVAEDPHFGNEYFLRTETLTAGLRWTALLSGRFEFSSLSLMRPSLNLVRDADGHWNIERWLPPAPSEIISAGSRSGFVGPLADTRAVPAARLYRIDVDTGRINFKQRDDKIPFALTDVSGSVNQDMAGHWQLDLEARPMRAGVELQDIGSIRVRGTIAGTSARLQPAELNVTWRAASLADTLRLARQDDFGLRGELSVELNARVAPPASGPAVNADSGGAQWSISGIARLTGIHGWRLPAHDADPAANLSFDATWRVGESRAQIRNLVVEMPGSRLQGTGDADWGHGFHPQLHIESSTLALADILSWYRSMLPGVAEDLRADGSFGIDVKLGGWPLQLQHGAVASAGAMLTSNSLPAPLKIGPVNAGVSHGGLDFAATAVSLSPAAPQNSVNAVPPEDGSSGVFLLHGSIFPESGGAFRWPPNWNLSVEGATPRVQDWLLLSRMLAQPVNIGWTASGGLALKMRGSHPAESTSTSWFGTIDSRDLAVTQAYVNQPVALSKAHLEFAPGQQTITLSAARAFGANWHGTLGRKSAVKQWTFDLSADLLDATELDRWLGPRARPGFLQRLTSFGVDADVNRQSDVAVARIEARGRLRAAEIVVAPIRLEKFDGDVELSGRDIKVRKAGANFFGGQAAGMFDAQLLADPSYRFQGRFDRVNLVQLAHAVTFLNDRMAGTASGALSLSAHGIGRQNLIGSLEGNGTLNAQNAELRGFDLTEIFRGDTKADSPVGDDGAPSSQFDSLQGTFQIHGGGIDLADFVLNHSPQRLQADGRVDFSHVLNLRIRSSILQAGNPLPSELPSAPPSTFLLSGTIENPKLVPPTSVPKPATKSATRRR